MRGRDERKGGEGGVCRPKLTRREVCEQGSVL